ncbi:MAG: hypothetical protein QM803_03375 [Rhodocyclaceae bacterium]
MVASHFSSAQSAPLLLAHALGEQRDIKSLLGTLQRHLGCRVNIALAGSAPLAEGVYFLADSGQLEYWTDVASLPAGNLLRARYAASPYQCDGSVLSADFPQSIALAPYRRLGHYVTCPLQTDIYLGGIEFILSDAGISDVDVTFLSQLAGLVANALVQIEQRQADFECEEQALEAQRSLQVLVDITNSVLLNA